MYLAIFGIPAGFVTISVGPQNHAAGTHSAPNVGFFGISSQSEEEEDGESVRAESASSLLAKLFAEQKARASAAGSSGGGEREKVRSNDAVARTRDVAGGA